MHWRSSHKVRSRVRLELLIDDRVVLDDTSAKLLMLIDEFGSLLKASRALKIPYSRAWECVARIERFIGGKVIEARRGGRGGGGASLTPLGRELLEAFLSEYRRVLGGDLIPPRVAAEVPGALPLIYAGSHDVAVGRLAGILKESGVGVEIHWIGSLKGLASLLLNEGDVAGVHLLDRESGEYNVPAARRLLAGKAVLVRGYERLQVLVSRTGVGLDEALDSLLKGEAVLANRVYGSGTRVLMESLLERRARELGIDPKKVPKLVKGFRSELRTHYDVVKAVNEGSADVGLTIECVARAYGLKYVPVAWERFDFIIRVETLETARVREFLKALRSEAFRDVIKGINGYRVNEGELGSVIEL